MVEKKNIYSVGDIKNARQRQNILGTKENPEYSFEDEFGLYWPHMDTIWGDFEKVEMTYADLCRDLGFDPDVRFVDVTSTGSITFTVGKPDEIRALWRAVNEKGYKRKSRQRRKSE